MPTIHLPFVHLVDAIPKRASLPRTYRVLDVLRVDVPEIAFSDLPLAGRLIGRDKATEFRLLGGGLIRSSDIPGAMSMFSDKARLPENWRLADKIMSTGIPSLDRDLDPYARKDRDLVPIDDLHQMAREIVSSDEMDRRQFFQDQLVTRLCTIDGKIHLAHDEPVWHVGETNLPGIRALTVHHSTLREHCFRIDRLNDALAFAGVNPKSFEQAFEDEGVHAWAFDELSHASKLLAERLSWWMESLHFASVAGGSPGFFDAYCKLRDWEQHDIATLLDATRAFQHSFPYGPSHDDLRLGIEKLLSEWNWIAQRSLDHETHDSLVGFSR